MKTTIVLSQKSLLERVLENIKGFMFKQYCFFHTLLNHPVQMKKVYWSVSDCYIEIGRSGYISNGNIYDLNGDITSLRDLVVNDLEPIKISLSEKELKRISEIARKRQISIKDLLVSAVEKLRQTETNSST